MPSDVCKARTVAEGPEPTVIDEPGARVEPEIRFCAFGVRISLPIVRAAGEVPAAPAPTEGRKEVLGP